MSTHPDSDGGLASVDFAIDWIDRHVGPLGAETVPATEAAGRVLAAPAMAACDLPPFDRAAIDGIAVRAEETLGASAYNPLSFRLVPPGETLPPCGAARVDAGAVLPGGADGIVPLEQALDAAGGCEIIEPLEAGRHVEPRGSHAGRGAMLLAAGRRLRPGDIGLLAAAGVAHVRVIRRPRVRVLLTGRFLARPGAVHDADGPLLRALIARDGGIAAELRTVARDRVTLGEALAAPGPDIVLVAGSTGNGTDDEAASALADAGGLVLRGVALSPGEFTGLGRVGSGVPIFLLPGAPASCLWAYELLAGRAIRRLAGRDAALPFRSSEMRTRRKIVSRIGMTEIVPVRRDDADHVVPIASFAEAGLMAAARADGFVIVAEGSEGFAEGAAVTVFLYEWPTP